MFPSLLGAMGKAIAKRWKEISPEEAERYKDLAAKDMERYKREMDEYHTAAARIKRLAAAEGGVGGGAPGSGGREPPSGGGKSSGKKSSSAAAAMGMNMMASSPYGPTGMMVSSMDGAGGGDMGGMYKASFEGGGGMDGAYYRGGEADLLRMNAFGSMGGGGGMDPSAQSYGAATGAFGQSAAAAVMYPGAARLTQPQLWGGGGGGMGGGGGGVAFGNPYLDPTAAMVGQGMADAMGGFQGGFDANQASFRTQLFNSMSPGSYAMPGATAAFHQGMGVPQAQFLSPQQPIYSMIGAAGGAGQGGGGFGVYGAGEMVAAMGPDAASMGGMGLGAGGGAAAGGGGTDERMMMIQQMIQQQQQQQQLQQHQLQQQQQQLSQPSSHQLQATSQREESREDAYM
jgi:HMG (high mobility group) box